LVGPDAGDLIAALSQEGLMSAGLAVRIRDEKERYGQFTPILRFTLVSAEERSFGVQRMCYLGSIDDWIDIGASGQMEQLAHEIIPKLGTDRFFELY